MILSHCLDKIVCELYADDLKLYRYMHINPTHCASNLQTFLDRLVLWSQTWQLNNIFYKKCAILRIGNNITDHVISVAANHVSNVDVVKDLGILVDEFLTFSSHMSYCYSCIYQKQLDS